MDRFATLSLLTLLCCVGCGSNSQSTAESSNQRPSPSVAQPTPQTSPTDVVSQFLDEIRRGGQDSHAHHLLTQRAQAELKRIGRTVEPIGSPDARFSVTRAEMLPEENNSALVHSIWMEPNGDGTTSDYQVVWAVEQEAGQWRISGLAMEIDPKQSPLIIDFENGEMMARLLAAPDLQPTGAAPAAATPPATAPSGIPSQAAAADPSLSR